MNVIFSREECKYIAYTQNERALRSVDWLAGVDVPSLRLRFASAVVCSEGDAEFELSRDELRALDTLLTDADPRGHKLPDGEPVLGLVEKLWRCMIGANGDSHAERDEDYHLNAHPDDREAIPRS